MCVTRTSAWLLCFAATWGLCGAVHADSAWRELQLGVDAGYAYRAHVDLRNHGLGTSLILDAPQLIGDLGLRGSVQMGSWPGSSAVDAPIFFPVAGAEVLASFGMRRAEALLGFGGFVGAGIDGDVFTAPRFGVLASATLRVPLTVGVSGHMRFSFPVHLYGPEGLRLPFDAPSPGDGRFPFPFVAMGNLGVTVRPGVIIDLVSEQGFAGLLP
jgi:hypothetical protein